MNVKRNGILYISMKTKLNHLERFNKDEWLNTKTMLTLNGGNATIKDIQTVIKNSIKFALDYFISLLIYCPF